MAKADHGIKPTAPRHPTARLRFAVIIGFVIQALAGVSAAARAEAVPAAAFPFALQDTSLPGESGQGLAADTARLGKLDAQLRKLLVDDGGYTLVDLAPVEAQTRSINLRGCNGCDLDFARKVGAKVSVLGWVQKVSNLILNINVVIRDVSDGSIVRGGSVDIRGDTDESWSRGLAYLFANVLFPPISPPCCKKP